MKMKLFFYIHQFELEVNLALNPYFWWSNSKFCRKTWQFFFNRKVFIIFSQKNSSL